MPYCTHSGKAGRLQERPWVFIYGALLSGSAGFVNVVLREIYHVPVSHMSGAVSRMGAELAVGGLKDLPGALAIFLAFLFGAMLSGLIIGGGQVQPGRRYGVAMMLEGAVLTLATLLLQEGRQGGIPLAAMACGLQNAMASSYCGLILRTTHVTGIVTDIGVMLGQWLRLRRIEGWKLVLLFCLLGGFFCGGLLGGWGFVRFGVPALFIVAGGVSLAGVVYFLWRRRQRLVHLSAESWGSHPPKEA